MEVSSNHTGSESFLDLDQNFNVREILVISGACFLTFWCTKYMWGRRNLYKSTKGVPGPLYLPIIGSSLELIMNPFDATQTLCNMFDKYNGMFRFWLGHLLYFGISDPDKVQIILNNHSALGKAEVFTNLADSVIGEGLLTAPVMKWKKNRRAMLPTFNQKTLNSFLEHFNEKSITLTNVLKKHVGKTNFDLFAMISRTNLDIICETAMGVNVNALNSDNDFVYHVERFLKISFGRAVSLWKLNDFLFNLTPESKVLNESVKYINNFTSNVIKERKEEFIEKFKDEVAIENRLFEDNGEKKTFLDLLFYISMSGEHKFTDKDLQDEVHTFLIAGSDTSSSALCFALTMFGMFPEMQEKAYQEVMDILGPERNVQPTDINRLVYLERFIKETLRLFPSSIGLVRKIENDIDLKDGHFLPKGSDILVGILPLQRSEKYWPDPLKFDPDRFLPENSQDRHPCTFIPFSFGVRNCIGLRYAMMSMKTVLAHVIRSYKVTTGYTNVNQIVPETHVIFRPKGGFKVRIEAR